MPDYLKPIKNSDSPLVKVSKYILASYSINDNINQPITDVISTATAHLDIDTEDWTLATARGIWNRTASEWNTRAKAAGIEWGTKQGIQARKSEITARIQSISGDIYSCRPLELVDSSPFLLPLVPAQVFIVTTASEIVVTINGKVEGYVHGPLSLKLKLSERLVRACISSSFNLTASVLPAPNRIEMLQFLVPPLSLPSLVPLDIHRSRYGNVWPDQSTRIVQDCQQLQAILLNGNNNIDTLILLAHQAYNHMGWIQWARQMSSMSANSSFGIGYVADRDIVFERDRTLYGRHGLDYIIAIPNHSLQILSAYLLTRTGPKFPSARTLSHKTSLSKTDISAIRAINERARDEPEMGAEAIQGAARYPGEAVKRVFAVDEV